MVILAVRASFEPISFYQPRPGCEKINKYQSV